MPGLLGGTFDPPHYGHIALAEAAMKELGLDRIMFIPAHMPPHKNSAQVSSKSNRLAMLRLALEDHPAFEISDIEFERAGPSYTIDTIRRLKKRCPGEEFVFLLGTDNVAEMEGWYQPERIFDEVMVAAVNRPGFAPEGRFVSMIRYFDMPPLDISSTMIRQKIKARRSVAGLLPPKVEKYIIENDLYKNNG